jgi:hypothetical protein
MEVTMRRSLWLLVPVALASGGACNNRSVGFAVVSIRPIYGWDDGCNTVTVHGHGFGDDLSALSAKIGDGDMSILAPGERPADVGYVFYAQVPPNTAGDFYDVKLSKGDESDAIPKGYYYLECPRSPNPESMSGLEAASAGSTVTITGCNLDATTMSVVVGTAAPVPLTSTCGEGIVTFAAPDLPPGEYPVSIVDSTGAVLYPVELCDDTAIDTACVPDTQYVIVYGGAR